MHGGAALMGRQRLETEGAREVDDGRAGLGGDGGRHLGDGVIGRGDDEHVDPTGGAGQVVVATQVPGEGPAARRERDGQDVPARPGPMIRMVCI